MFRRISENSAFRLTLFLWLMTLSVSVENTVLCQEVNTKIIPLEDGRCWLYTAESGTMLREVVADPKFAGFFRMTDCYRGREGREDQVREYLCRLDTIGNLEMCVVGWDSLRLLSRYTELHDDGISKWYRTDAHVGDRWLAFGNSETAPSKNIWPYLIVLASHLESVKTPLAEFDSCYAFKIGSVTSSNHYWDEWFKPGVGMVRKRLRETGPDYVLNKTWKR